MEDRQWTNTVQMEVNQGTVLDVMKHMFNMTCPNLRRVPVWNCFYNNWEDVSVEIDEVELSLLWNWTGSCLEPNQSKHCLWEAPVCSSDIIRHRGHRTDQGDLLETLVWTHAEWSQECVYKHGQLCPRCLQFDSCLHLPSSVFFILFSFTLFCSASMGKIEIRE